MNGSITTNSHEIVVNTQDAAFVVAIILVFVATLSFMTRFAFSDAGKVEVICLIVAWISVVVGIGLYR